MDLLVAFKNDAAGHNMAKHISQNMEKDGDMYRGKNFDLIEIDTPAISCHSTGNFNEAKFGGNAKELAIPYPNLQKKYLKTLWENRESFSDFEITIEATHHGPTHLKKPSIFVEIGTTDLQWNDEKLCSSVAIILKNSQKNYFLENML